MFPFLLLTLFTVLGVASSEKGFKNSTATPYLSCDPEKNPLELRVKGCPELPCKFPQRTMQELEVDFLVDEDTEVLTPQVIATTLGMQVQFPLPERDGCKVLTNAECPLDKGEEVTYKLALEMSEKYPPVALIMQLSLFDARQKTLACFKITANVVVN